MAPTMSRAVESWSATDTDVGAVEAAALRLRAAQPRGSARSTTLTLVVLADDDHAIAAAAREDLRALGRPPHAVVVCTFPAAPPGIDAWVTLLELTYPGSTTACCEEIVLHVRGPAADHLDSVITPWARPEVQLVVWLPGRLPRADEPVLAIADRVLIDSERLSRPEGLAVLAARDRGLGITDLAWLRAAPWREVLVALFQPAVLDPFLRDVGRLEIAGRPGPRGLLAGWLLGDLGVDVEIIQLVDEAHLRVALWGQHLGHATRLTISLEADAQAVVASAAVAGERWTSEVVARPVRSDADVLGAALTGPDDAPWRAAAVAAFGDAEPVTSRAAPRG